MRLLLIAAALWRGGGAKESRTLTLERHRRDRHHPTKQAACTNTCPACLNTKRPRLYSLLHVDGVGTTVKYVLEHARFARDHGYAYGGAVGALPATPQAHGVVQRRCVEWALGTDTIVVAMPSHATRVAAVEDLKNETTLWTEKHTPLPVNEDKKWAADLRRGNACRLKRTKLTYAPQSVRVGAHLRRGDVDASVQPSLRWVSDECLVRALAWVASIVGIKADVHVFSALEPHKGRNGQVRGAGDPHAFDAYRKQNYTVHLNAGDATRSVLDHWAHLASTDVFLQSPTSAFAAVPAYFNSGCVLQARAVRKGLHCYALDADDETCVRRAVERRLRGLTHL